MPSSLAAPSISTGTKSDVHEGSALLIAISERAKSGHCTTYLIRFDHGIVRDQAAVTAHPFAADQIAIHVERD